MYNKIMYEWDEAKRLANLKKHRLDFIDAYLVYENPEKVTIDLPGWEEMRYMDLSLVEVHGRVLALIYTLRVGNLRCISYRNASREERQIYETLNP